MVINTKRILSLIGIFGVIAALFAGCGGGSGSSAAASSAPASSAASTASSEAEPAGEEEIVPLTVFIDFTWFDTEKFEGIIPDEITRQTGVTLIPTKAADEMQLGVLIASNDLHDLVYSDKLQDRMSNSNICYPYNELIEQYAPTFKPSDDEIMIATSYSSDGNYYMILNANSSEEDWRAAKAGSPTMASLVYRRDIVDELGMYPMETLDDYVNVLAAVKEKYPDMTGLTMEYTFMTNIFRVWLIDGWVPTRPYMQETADQKIIHQTSAPGYRDFLKFMNNLYLNGYINPDNFAFTDGTQSEELCMTNKAFSMSFMTGNVAQKLDRGLKDNGFDGYFEHVMPLSEYSYVKFGLGWAGTYITRNNSNPEKSIQLMEWMFSPEGQRITQWGREGYEYTLDADGVPVFSDEWLQAREDGTMTEKYNPNFYFGISGVVEAIGRASGIPENAKEVMNAIRVNMKTSVIPGLVAPKGDSDEKIKMDQITEFVKNQETKIYLSANEAEFEANVAELYAKLDQIGIKEIEEYFTTNAQQYYS